MLLMVLLIHNPSLQKHSIEIRFFLMAVLVFIRTNIIVTFLKLNKYIIRNIHDTTLTFGYGVLKLLFYYGWKKCTVFCMMQFEWSNRSCWCLI